MQVQDLDHNALKNFPDFDGHETVRRVHDPVTGLTAFIGIHNTNIGPALGGCRMYPYASDAEAIRDVLRLSRGMTYKNALAGLPLGGGKTVIVGNPMAADRGGHKTDALMASLGRAVEGLKGRYITAEDSGTNEHDMKMIATETSYVLGLPSDGAGDALGGDPSPATAWGVFTALKVAAERRYGGDTPLAGIKVAVQGLGAVGFALCRLLHQAGAKLVVTDIRAESIARAEDEFPGIRIVNIDEIFGVEAKIFAPCALGAQLNDKTIPQLRVDIVCGAANNQLEAPRHEAMLAEKGILYAPDFVVNAGGVIAVAYEYFHRTGQNPFGGTPLTRATLMQHVGRIGDTLRLVLDTADSKKLPPGRAANALAEDIFLRPTQQPQSNIA